MGSRYILAVVLMLVVMIAWTLIFGNRFAPEPTDPTISEQTPQTNGETKVALFMCQDSSIHTSKPRLHFFFVNTCAPFLPQECSGFVARSATKRFLRCQVAMHSASTVHQLACWFLQTYGRCEGATRSVDILNHFLTCLTTKHLQQISTIFNSFQA